MINTKEIKVEDEGLTSSEAKKRLQKYGYNEIVKKKRISPVRIFLSQFNDFIIWVLIAATAISSFMGENADAITILIIIILDAVLGFIQEFRTEKSLEALGNLSAPNAKVLRDRKLIIIKAKELVIGDVIEIEAGDRIPADCIVTYGNDIQSDESILTGESIPIEKKTYSANQTPGKNNFVYMGCSITNGRGRGKIIAVGMDTEMGKIADMLQNIETESTPLQKKLNHLGKLLVIGCLIICAVVTITGILRGEDAYSMFLVGVSLAVAAIPEGLPAIVTVSLAIGVQKMMNKNALVRKLPAVETLGCTNVICSDKTGTLTQNKMTVKRVYVHNKYYDISGDGYGFEGNITYGSIKLNGFSEPNLKKMAQCFTLCSNSNIPQEHNKIKSDSKKSFYGDPTEIALLVMSLKVGINNDDISMNFKRIKEAPFDSDRKMMSVLCTGNNEKYVFSKGAVESLISKCNYILINEKEIPLTKEIINNLLKANNLMAESALRVIAAGYKKVDLKENNIIENDLIFIGMAGMIDPPRREVKESIFECRMAGIMPVMITGDHKLTAKAIAEELKMLDKDGIVITGEELDKMTDSQLESKIDKIKVYARVNPSHKHRIVKIFKKKGFVVAMTGDGVNDAPAIKEANIGISMGISGTDVTKEASSMILLDDNFATIVSAVKEGRAIYENIRKFIRYLLSCNIGEVLTMFVSVLLNLPIPLIPIQILLVNLATDGLPAMALSFEPEEKDIMMRRPRRKDESIFSDGLWSKILLRGFLIGLCTIVSFAMTLVVFGGNLVLSRTVALCTLVMSQLFHVFECKSERHSIFKIGIKNNLYLVFAVISSMVMLIMTVYIPFLQKIFYTQSLDIIHWLIVLAFSGTVSLFSSIFWYR